MQFISINRFIKMKLEKDTIVNIPEDNNEDTFQNFILLVRIFWNFNFISSFVAILMVGLDIVHVF